MKERVLLLILALAGFLWQTPCFHSSAASPGTIEGYVLLPGDIDPAVVAGEARVFVYLKDFTPKNGKEVLPWDAPVERVIAFEIRSLKDRRISFAFPNLPAGTYGVSVLIDTGRPHVLPGSKHFTAYPGDYAGGTRESVKLEPGQILNVEIAEGMYITIPEGYDAPLYATE